MLGRFDRLDFVSVDLCRNVNVDIRFAVFLFFFMTFSAQDEIPAENAAAAHAKSESPLRDLTRFHIYLFLDSARCFIICHLRSGATSSRLI
ncbi:hypothetical protein PN4B1_43960 [Paenibacillus naphthalenovorans]|nr:hypothetical protein PN4B1_43960 [Paenibacillus naphthalenovorans]